MITTTDIKLGTLYFNGEVCTEPNIQLVGYSNLAIKCIDDVNGIYRIQTLDGSAIPAELTFVVSCGTCDECPPKVITRRFCSTNADCEPCHDCIDGVCVSRCTDSQTCVNDTCVSCQEDSDCDCNQVCTPTGCQCPTGTTFNPINKCCDYCDSSTDCGPCSDCLNIGGVNTCVPKVCPDGVCDPVTGDCVECLTSGDCDTKSCKYCDPVLRRCVAGEGQVQVGNDCVPAPDCVTDADCNDPCLACGPSGKCVPIQCSGGKVPARIGNTCTCVEECDCDDPGSCSDQTKYCTAISPDTCGCLSCKGDCTSGCEDPCYCDPLLNKCVANPCTPGPCNNGLDCGPGCGCQNGECVPCSSLSCQDASCEQVLGCKCAGISCVPDDCGNKPCTTSFDCSFGCTCEEGVCVGCSNFSCSTTDDCSTQIGCACVNGDCKGDPTATCSDVLALIKNDDNCSLTGSLETDTCCQCSPLTLAVKGRRTTSTSSEYNIVFQAELRKGEFNGVNVSANPLLDDISNENIAENEVPTSGTITYQAYTTYNIYKDFGSGYVQDGVSTEGPQTGLASFIGGTAIVTFPEASFKKIGVTEQVDPQTQREAIEVEINFFQSSHLIAPNKCSYRAVVEVGSYQVFNNDDWLAFDTTTATNGIGTTVTSTVCRDPFFKWRKDGEVFRKLYVAGSNNVYSDLLERPPVTELESCSTYSLEVDCSCEKNISDLVTFCNPEDIQFTLTNCGRRFTLTSFETCGPNLDQEFFIKGGTLDIKFKGSNPPINTVYDSDTCIDELQYGLSCDTECTKTYTNTCSTFTADYTTTCSEDGQTFTITFASTVEDQAGNTYAVERVEIAGFTLTPGTGFSRSLPFGSYNAVIYPTGGCDSFEELIVEDCCSSTIPEISRDCDGNVTCTENTDVVYKVNGVIQTDVCGYVASLPVDQSATIIASKGGCPDQTIVIPSLASFCCDNYTFVIEQQSSSAAFVQVYSGGDTITLAVSPATGVTVTKNSTNEFTVTGLTEGNSYTFTTNSSTCGTLSIPYTQTDCAIPVTITQPSAPDCDELIATVPSQTCECKNGEFRAQVQSIDTNLPNTVEVTFQTSIQQFDAKRQEGTVVFIDQDGIETDFGCVNCIGTATFPRPEVRDCINGLSLVFELQDDATPGNVNSTLELALLLGGITSNLVPEFQSVQITVNGTTVSTPNGNGIYIFSQCCLAGCDNEVSIAITINHTNGREYRTQIKACGLTGQSKQYILGEVCTNTTDVVTVPLKLQLRDLELEDACEYPTKTINFTYQANNEVVVPTTVQTVGLAAIDPDAREVKFVWTKNGSVILTDFQPTQSVLTNTYLEQGADYRVTAICDPCQDAEDKNFCCIPLVTFTDNGITSFDINIQGLPGTYELDVEGTIYPITLSGTGIQSTSVTYNGPLSEGYDYSVDLSIPGTTCVDNYTYTSPVVPVPALEFSVCNPITGFYEFAVTNAEPGWALNIESGTGVIAGQGEDMRVSNIDEFDPTVFNIDNRGTKSANYVANSPTSCYSSSTVPVSSSNAASSSVAASSSIPASSSNPESSGAPASSSNVVSSSVPASSSAVPSSPLQPPSSQPSSSIAQSSSPAPPSAQASSSIPASSSAVLLGGPSSCPTILEITQSNVSCTYNMYFSNPDNTSATAKAIMQPDGFSAYLDYDCRIVSSCDPLETRHAGENEPLQVGVRAMWSAVLQTGDVAHKIVLVDPTRQDEKVDIWISPQQYTANCGCVGCGSFDPAALVYTAGFDAQFEAAVNQALLNAMCAEGFTNKRLQVQVQNGVIKVALWNRHDSLNDPTLAWPCTNSGNTYGFGEDFILRSEFGVGSLQITVEKYLVGLFDTAKPLAECRFQGECGSTALFASQWSFASGAPEPQLRGYYDIPSNRTSITSLGVDQTCGHAELVATLSGGSCSPSFNWGGTGTIRNSTAQTVYVYEQGTYNCAVTGCSGCDTLNDTEVVGPIP